MPDRRPDPDQLLARLHSDERQARRGQLKIFFGASAGVGKTYAMLSAALAAQTQGVDVLAGVIETHGRSETQALAQRLPALPLQSIEYRGRRLAEFDLDSALARRPQLLLVDELAHSNAPGSRHPKRWQDVEELLGAGIDVWSTVNVQHLETLNDVVAGITGIHVGETVPDKVFDQANEVVIVDLPPEELLKRLQEGKVYLPQQAEHAVRNFFRKGNLIALRELALRRTADRVDDQMRSYRRELVSAPVWQTREALLLCIGPDERSETLIRGAARLAAQLDAPWHCIVVETPAFQRRPEAERRAVMRMLESAEEAGARTATVPGHELAAAVVRYAHDNNLARVILGRDPYRRTPRWRMSLAEAIGEQGPDLDVLQIALPPRARRTHRSGFAASPHPGPGQGVAPGDAAEDAGHRALARVMPYVKSALVCVCVTLLTAPLHTVLDQANIVMMFLLAVVFVAMRQGRGPAVLAAFVSVASFDFFHVPPRYAFSVTDAQYLLTFAVMLINALVIGQLTAGLKFQAMAATRREERVAALYAMSRDLSAALLVEQVAQIGATFLQSQFEAPSALLVLDDDGRVQLQDGGNAPSSPIDMAIAQWALDHSQEAGHGTGTLPGAPLLYVPLQAPMRVRGVMAIEPRHPARLAGPEQRRLLATMASLMAISLERVHYIEVARRTTVQMESERLRHSLLAAISHDLRTPLASLVGMAESLTILGPGNEAQRRELASGLHDAALRLNSLVTNLLDMARLQSGQVQLRKQWQPLEEVIGTSRAALGSILGDRAIEVRLPDDLPLVDVDPVLFERVLVNLLENAAKYSPAGSPIEIGAQAGPQTVSIWIDDHGPGLPAGREEAIFEMFERGRKESATPGVGLGLAICRSIVQAHGGTIRGGHRRDGKEGARLQIDLPRGSPPLIDTLEPADFDEQSVHE